MQSLLQGTHAPILAHPPARAARRLTRGHGILGACPAPPRPCVGLTALGLTGLGYAVAEAHRYTLRRVEVAGAATGSADAAGAAHLRPAPHPAPPRARRLGAVARRARPGPRRGHRRLPGPPAGRPRRRRGARAAARAHRGLRPGLQRLLRARAWCARGATSSRPSELDERRPPLPWGDLVSSLDRRGLARPVERAHLARGRRPPPRRARRRRPAHPARPLRRGGRTVRRRGRPRPRRHARALPARARRDGRRRRRPRPRRPHARRPAVPARATARSSPTATSSRGARRGSPGTRGRGTARATRASAAPTGVAPYLHVSAGLGTSPYAPVRFACPPEATLLTLSAARLTRPRRVPTACSRSLRAHCSGAGHLGAPVLVATPGAP